MKTRERLEIPGTYIHGDLKALFPVVSRGRIRRPILDEPDNPRLADLPENPRREIRYAGSLVPTVVFALCTDKELHDPKRKLHFQRYEERTIETTEIPRTPFEHEEITTITRRLTILPLKKIEVIAVEPDGNPPNSPK